MNLERVISGGQTGADEAGWRAAWLKGFSTGGWMPLGYLTEIGPRPDFARLYGANEHPSAQYPPRTEANVRDSCGTVWFGRESPGYFATLRAVNSHRKRKNFWTVKGPDSFYTSAWMAEKIVEKDIRILNIAGNRESSAPGIGEWVERYLAEVFQFLREQS